jgi:hypothetical protein
MPYEDPPQRFVIGEKKEEMSFVYKVFVEKLLLTYFKGLLDKMPGSGYKTILGVIVLIVSQLIVAAPEYAPFLEPVLSFLNLLPGGYIDIVTDASIVTIVTGLVHKLLKYFKK